MTNGPAHIDLSIKIIGYLEVFSESEIVGWTWRESTQDRLRVELRSGNDMVSSTIADIHRADLEKNGIGDGCHAFRLTIPVEARGSIAQPVVVAIAENGVETLLTPPPTSLQLEKNSDDIRRNLELLVGSQRVIHRNLQAALLRQEPSLADEIAKILETQARLDKTLATLELVAIRIEASLEPKTQGNRSAETSFHLKFYMILACIAFLLSCVSLWRVLVLN